MASEPYGTTPLPVKGVAIHYDPVNVWDVAQQPKSQQIAVYEGSKNEDSIHGATILDVNQHFVIYAVKKGLIRILHRHSTLRTLFRGHAGKTVTDIRFFLDGDVLGSVATGDDGSSSVIIWRVFERTPEIMSEKLLEITTPHFTISRLIWHPFNPNQFWMIHTTNNDIHGKRVASLVETTRITTLPHETEGHAVCRFHTPNIIMDGAMQLSSPEATSLVDLDWSEKDVRHVLTVHQGGEIRLCDLRKVETMPDGTLKPACLCLIKADQPLSRCRLLPHECPRDQPSQREKAYTTCFLTAANENSVVTLWSPFREGSTPPTKLQVFGFEYPSPSYLLDICYGPGPPEGPPPSLFVLLADQNEGKLFAWHLESEWEDQSVVSLVGCDYVVPFQATYPMYSWSTKVAPAADISEDDLTDQGGLIFDMKLFSYQSSVVQCLTLTSFMCLPPENQWSEGTPGVRVEELQQQEMGAVSEMALSEDFEGEDYDIGDEEEDAYSEPPEASALPPPDMLDSPAAAAAPKADPVAAVSSNPFANWLGAIAGKTMGAAPPPPPMPPMVEQVEMLTPADIMSASSLATSSNPSPMPQQPDHPSNNQIQNKTKNNKQRPKSRSRSPRGGRGKQKKSDDNGGKAAQQQLVTILKRDADEPSVPAPAAPIPLPGMATNTAGAAILSAFQTQVSAVSEAALAEQFQQQEALILKEIQRVIRVELKSTLMPMIDQKVRECLTMSVEPVLSALNSLGKDGVHVDNDKLANVVASKVEDPLRAAFAENMKDVLIPAFESVSGQMFAQISSGLERGMAQKEATTNRELHEVKMQLSNMFSLVQQLSSEIQSLRSMAAEQGIRGRGEAAAPRTLPGPSMVDQKQVMEQEVMTLLGQRQYEAAFTKALSASTVEMALFVCKNADLPDVLGGSSPALSQPILLCLMHQLGTSVMTADNESTGNLQMELAWLQEISLSINPADESMRRHLPGVLQQLVNGINTKMTQNPAMRRPLQRLLQVLRGMQV